MSTIAWRRNVMVSDSRGTSGDIIRGDIHKLHQLKDGRVVGIAGDHGFAAEFVAWLEKGAPSAERPDFSVASGFTAIVGEAGGFVVYGKDLREQAIDAEFYAIGSGNEIALGAMAFGATARQAVEIACKFDVYSGGEITEITAKSRPVPKRAAFNPRAKAPPLAPTAGNGAC